MARNSVGQLSAQIVADASQFNSVIDGAESKIKYFGNRLGGLLGGGGGAFIGGALGGLAGGALADTVKELSASAQDFIGSVTGQGYKMHAFLHPIEAAEKSMERLVELGKGSEDFGVGSQFLRGLQIAAGPEVDKLEKVLVKLLNLKVELGAPGTNEDFIRRIIAEGSAIGGAAERLARAKQLVGEKVGMGLVELFQGGTEGLDRALAKIERLGLATEGNIELARQWKATLKDIALHQQAAEENSLLTGGLMGIGGKQMWAGHIGSGWDNFTEGAANWVGRLFGGEQMLSGEVGNKVFEKTWQDVIGAEKAGAPKEKLAAIREELTEIGKAMDALGNRGRMSDKLAERLIGMGASARGLIPKEAADVLPSAEWYKQMEVLRNINDQALILQLSYGKTAEEAAKIKDQVNGLNEAQQEAAASGRAWASATAIANANKTPEDKAKEELAQLDSVRGMLGDAEYEKALRRMRKSALGPQFTPDREANTALWGSQEWAKAFTRATQPQADKDDESLEEQKKATDRLEKIDDRLRIIAERKEAVLNIPPGG